MSINAPIPVIFFEEEYDDGTPLAGGKLYALEAGTSTPKITYTEPTGTTPSTHPIVLNAAGRCSVWLADGAYKWILTDADDNIIWTKDNVGLVGVDDSSLYAGSISALRSLPIEQSDFASVVVTGSNVLTYAWDQYSSVGDNGFSNIIPISAPATGRWILKYDGTISSSLFTNLADAVSKIGTANVTLTVSKLETLTANLIIPSNISLQFLKGGSVAGAFVLTMNGLLLSDERTIISASTVVRFGVNGVHKVQSRWFNTFTKAVASCTVSDNVVLEHDTSITVSDNVTVPSNVTLKIVNVGAILNIENLMTLTIEGKFEADRTLVFTGPGTVKLNSSSAEFICPEWFGVSEVSSDNTLAFQTAVNAANNSSGYSIGIVKVASGAFVLTGTLTLPANIIFEGSGSGLSVLVHNPDTFINMIEGNGSVGQIIIRDLGLAGRGGNTGNSKYLLNLVTFNKNSSLENLRLSDSVGYININDGSQCSITNVTCLNSTPNNVIAGLTDAEWGEVWGAGSAPINLTSLTCSVISDLTVTNVGSEYNAVVGNPYSVIRMVGCDSTVINGLAIYDIYNAGVYDIYANYMALFIDCTGMTINGAIFVNTHAYIALLGFERDCNFTISSFRADYVETSYLIHSSSVHSISVNGLGVFNSQIVSNYLIEQSGFSANGTINISNAFAIPGLPYTDPNVSIYPSNVTDTYEMDAAYREGISDNITSLHSTRRIVPKIGVTVAAGSNPVYTGAPAATGHYIEISSGTFINEAGNTLQLKRAQGTTAANVLCVYRLRPQTASYYYRVYISETGSPYLVKSVSAFANDLGNWVAQFRTNASTQIVKYSDGSTPGLDTDPYNPRSGYIGIYPGGSSLVQAYGTTAPIVGQWTRGDSIINSLPSSGDAFTWNCTASGTPGTWLAITYIDYSAPIFLNDVNFSQNAIAKYLRGETIQNGSYTPLTLTNLYNTAGSSDETIVTKYNFRGGNIATSKNAGSITVGKLGTYNNTDSDCYSDMKLAVSASGLDVTIATLSYDKGLTVRGRMQGNGIGSFVAAQNVILDYSRNIFTVSGTIGTDIWRLSSTNFENGSIITLIFKERFQILNDKGASGEYKPFHNSYYSDANYMDCYLDDVAQFVLDTDVWRYIGGSLMVG